MTLKKDIEKLIVKTYGKGNYYMIAVGRKDVCISLSHWGTPVFWTKELIRIIENCGLKFTHVSALEETVVLAEFDKE